MDQRILVHFLRELYDELGTLDEIIAGLERYAAGKPRKGRPPKYPRSPLGKLFKAQSAGKSK